MGSCISTPAKLVVISRKQHFHAKRTQSKAQHDESHRPTKSDITCVIQGSSGDKIFEKYRFGKELGRGEFGITHQCFDLVSGDVYACKMISKEKLRTEIDLEDVRREVQIMRHLPKHPNIVSFREAFEDKEAVYLVMELCEGGELFDRIVAKGHYTERAAATVVKTIIQIVKVCHQNGVIHRDLKPENFLFVDESEYAPLKAIDFGLSIFFKPGQHFSDIVGSPYYMAPEVLRRNYGKEIDVWSTGIILYILLCGVPPFWAETEEGIAHAIIKGHIDFERDPWPKVSEEAKDLVKCMLDANPYSRLTVDEVLDHSWIQNADKARNVSLGENVRTRIQQFSLMNKFKKKVLRVVADTLPNEEIDCIRQTFQMMDTDKTGDLTFEDLKHGLQKIGHPLPDPDIQMLMDAADVDGDGTLNCEEFITMSIHMKRMSSDEHLSEAFNFFDKNQTGYIELDELKEALLDDNLGSNNDQVVKDIMRGVDLDKDGRISYKEFKAMMQMGTDWKMASRQYSRALLNALSIKILRQSGQLR